MEDISLYLSPTENVWGEELSKSRWNSAVYRLKKKDEVPPQCKIAFIGVSDSRGSEFSNRLNAPNLDAIRAYLGQMEWYNHFPKIIDAGNIEAGNTVEDTRFALQKVLQYFLKRSILPIILGGSQDLTYAQYMSYESMEQLVNLVSVDYKIDLGQIDDELFAGNYLAHIIAHQPNLMFNYANLGHQVYFNSEEMLRSVERMFFETLRLGEINRDFQLTEPLIRNADLISFDLKAIKDTANPGNPLPMPNGISPEHACQIMWYSGLSDKLSSMGLYGFLNDKKSVSAQLVAQMIWYFVDGFSQRKDDFPKTNIKHYTKYVVQLNDNEHELIFFKSPKSDRWWVQVPYPDGRDARYFRHLIVPCSYSDYKVAANGEMPDVWWQTYQKLA